MKITAFLQEGVSIAGDVRRRPCAGAESAGISIARQAQSGTGIGAIGRVTAVSLRVAGKNPGMPCLPLPAG